MHFRDKDTWQAFRFGIDPIPQWAEEARGKRIFVGGDTLSDGKKVMGTPDTFIISGNPGQIGWKSGKKGDYISTDGKEFIGFIPAEDFDGQYELVPRCEHCKHFHLDRLSATHGSCHSYGLAQYNAKTGEFTPMQVTSDFGCVCFERKN